MNGQGRNVPRKSTESAFMPQEKCSRALESLMELSCVCHSHNFCCGEGVAVE